MMKKRQFFVMVIVVLFSMGILFAAGQQARDAKAEETIEITYWHFPRADTVQGFEDVSRERGDFEAYLAKKFTEMDNGIAVKTEMVPWTGGFERINVAIASGNPPPVLIDFLGRTSVYHQMGALLPVNEVLPDYIINDAYDDYLDLYTLDGILHALPVHDGAGDTLNINVGLLKKHGWEGPILNGPGKPYTFEQFTDFLMKARAILPPEISPAVWSGGDEQADYAWWNIFAGFGGKLFNPDGTVTNDYSGMIKGYEYLKKLHDQGLLARGIPTLRGNDGTKLFTAGLTAVRAATRVHAIDLKSAIEAGELDFDYEVMAVPFPSESGDVAFNTVGPTAFVFFDNVDPAKTAAAAKFIEFYLSEMYWPPKVKASGRVMLQKSFSHINLYEGDGYMDQLKDTEWTLFDNGITHPDYQRIRLALAQSHQKIFTNTVSIEKAVEDFYREAREIVSK